MNLQASPTKPSGARERSLDEVKAEFLRRAGRLTRKAITWGARPASPRTTSRRRSSHGCAGAAGGSRAAH